MNTKKLIARSIGIVSFIFAAFGGFLKDIAPPEEAHAKYAIGISSMLVLCLLLVISALSQHKPQKKFKNQWLTTSIITFILTIIFSLMYYWLSLKYTFTYPSENEIEELIAGSMLTPDAKEYLNRIYPQNLDNSQLLADFGGIKNRHMVWTNSSIIKVKIILTITYIMLVLSLSTTIFCLTEGILTRLKAKR